MMHFPNFLNYNCVTFFFFLMSVFNLFILQALGWNLCPKTAISWLTLYLQSALMKKRSDVLEPQLPQDVFLQMTCVGL